MESPLPDIIIGLILDETEPIEFDKQLKDLFDSPARLFDRLIDQTTPPLCSDEIRRVFWSGNSFKRIKSTKL